MIRFTASAILFGIWASTSSAAAQIGTLARDPIALCPRTSRPPKIDGELDDACWKGAPSLGDFALPKDAGKAREQTQVHLAYDGKGLYVAFRCAEPEMSKIKTGEQLVWRNDSVEVYVDSDRDRQGYFQLVADIAGGRFQQLAGISAETPDRTWNAGWKCAAAKWKDEWTAEFFIPAAALGVKMQDGTAIRANFARNEKGIPEASSWTARTGGVTSALHFGNVVFGGKTPPITAAFESLTGVDPDRASVLLTLTSSGRAAVALSPQIRVMPPRGVKPVDLRKMRLPAGRKQSISAALRLPEEYRIGLDIWGRSASGRGPVFLASYLLTRAPATPRAVGAVLRKCLWGTVWEADATCKVMPNAPLPRESRKSVEVFCAGNEFEPFQIVLTPNREITGLRASVSDLYGPARIARDKVTVRLVETVPVTTPTSPDCAPGDYPDPLVPFESTAAPASRNTSLWFTIHVPADVPPGDYRGTVNIQADGIEPVGIPIKLRVWNFVLPKISRLRTAYACWYDTLCRWHGASTIEDKRKTAILVNRNFIEHRISPINPMSYWEFDTEPAPDGMRVIFDEWDKGAELFLPEMNSFNLPGAFMSSVRKHRADEPGYAEEKTQFLRLTAAHLKEKGWFEKGYNYIFDEPDPDEYAAVVREAEIWHKADPGFRILLTEQPEPELFGAVDIWTPVLDAYIRPICQARQAKGEDVWWYVCCGPHHPYPNNFIDYPAIDHRILHWMNWKYRVTGVLYWQTTFWVGSPWEHPMNDEGGKNLGNGDGSLLYPAVRKRSDKPLITGPLDSIRWEMIREGVEDYDYIAMLSDAIEQGKLQGADPKLINAARSAIDEVNKLVRSLTDYEKDPRKLSAARIKIGNVLDALLSASRSPTPALTAEPKR